MPRMSTRRKLAIASWSAPREGNIYGKITLDATRLQGFLARIREETGEKITITHFIGRVVGQALRDAPGLNGFLRFGAFHPHETADLSFLVALREGADLAQVKVERIDEKPIVEIARELRAAGERLHAGKNEEFKKSKGPLRLLPTWLIRPLLWLTGWLSGAAGLRIPALGVTPFPFGAAIVTSVGMFGLDEGFVPPVGFARVPLYVLIGAIREQPWVVDGEVVVRPMVTITATVDHRFMDGFQGGILARTIRGAFDDPEAFDRR